MKKMKTQSAVCFSLALYFLFFKPSQTCCFVFICSSPLTYRPNKGNTNVVARGATRESVRKERQMALLMLRQAIYFYQESCFRLWERSRRKDVRRFLSFALIVWEVKGIALQEHLHHLHLFTLVSLFLLYSSHAWSPHLLLLSNLVWQKLCRLKNKRSHFGRELLLCKKNKLPTLEKKDEEY